MTTIRVHAPAMTVLAAVTLLGQGEVSAAGAGGPCAPSADPRSCVVVHSNNVCGTAPAGAKVAASVTSSGGDERAAGESTADASDGWFTIGVSRPAPRIAPASGIASVPVRIGPTDIVTLSWSGSGPTRLEVPSLGAHGDPATRSVVGTAPPGTILTVTVDPGVWTPCQRNGMAPLAVLQVTATPSGAFVASFGDVTDAQGMPLDFAKAQGHVSVALGADAEAVLPWAVLTLKADLDTGVVSGTAGAGRQVRVVARDGTGDVLGSATAMAGSGYWYQPLRDALGQAVPLEVGDSIHLSVGDDALTVPVPPLAAVVDVADPGLDGRTSPEAELLVTVESVESARPTRIRSDAAGLACARASGLASPQTATPVPSATATLPQGSSPTEPFATPWPTIDPTASPVGSGTHAPTPSPAPTGHPAPVITLLQCRGRHEIVRILNAGTGSLALEGWRLQSIVGQ